MKVLVTGFDPFGGEAINPAYEAILKMKDKIEDHEIVKLEIPTVFKKSIDVLDKAMMEEKPDIVICVGQAGGRYDFTLERAALNISDARIPDNEGNQPIDEVIFEDGDTAYFSKLPIKATVEQIKKKNVPASVSNTAGTYVCNHVMYGLLYLIDKKYRHVKGGFVHVPFLPEQVLDKRNMPSMALNDITLALEETVIAAVNFDTDISITGGTIF